MMGMWDDPELMRLLQPPQMQYGLPPQPMSPAGYQPMPQMAPPPPNSFQQLLSQLRPYMPEVPGLMNPEAAGTPRQTLGIGGKRDKGTGYYDREYGGRFNIPY
jgi:hypothetical protein